MFKVEVNNAPTHTEEYIVARYHMGKLWYWGTWADKNAANRVAKELDNSLVLQKCHCDLLEG